ncbi:hypothetical protein JNL27_12840, partial [bacterium]|nr:hypothetical protein [bacterium]
SGRIEAVYTPGDFRDTTNTITVVAGTPARLAIENQRNGTGIEISSSNLTTDDSLKLFTAIYDAKNNFIGNVNVNWTLNGNIGALTNTVNSDSTILYPTTTGSGTVSATHVATSLTDLTGLITVNTGAADSLRKLSVSPDTLSPAQFTELKVKLIDSLKNAIKDSVIHFVINSGSGSLDKSLDTTDALGVASVRFTSPTTVGTSQVDVYLATLSDTAKFTIVTISGPLANYTILPSTLSDTAGASITATVTALDVYGNVVDDDTTQTRIDLIGSVTGLNGSGLAASSVFNVLTNGQHAVTVSDSVKENLQIKVSSRFDTTKTAVTSLITIRAAAPYKARFYPDSLTNVQSGQLGAQLIDSSSIIIKDQFGNTVNDTVTVRFIPTSTAAVNPSLRTTDKDGIARTKWTLRTTNAPLDSMLGIVPITNDTLRFYANILATGQDTLSRISNITTPDTVNQIHPDTFRVRVVDNFNNPISTKAITFSLFASPLGTDSAGFVRGPSNFVTTLDTITDINGYASVRFHAGTKVGTYIIRASNPSLLNPVVYDTIVAVHDAPRDIQILSGNNQSIQVGSFSDTLRVNVSDRYGNSITTGTEVHWRTSNFPGALLRGLVDAIAPGASGAGTYTTLDSASTFANGQGKAIWEVRRITGVDTIFAYLKNVDTVQFLASVGAGAVDSVIKVAGDSATGIANGNIVTLKNLVKDAFGNLINNATVHYSVTSGNAEFVGPDSAFTNANGISTITVRLGAGDSTRIQASASGASYNSVFTLYNLVFVDSSLSPSIMRNDTIVAFKMAFHNLGPYNIRLDTNQTRFRFNDGVNFYSARLTYADSVIAARSIDTLQFRKDTIPFGFKSTTFTPKIDFKGIVSGISDSLSGTIETNSEALTITGVDVIAVITPAPKLFSRGDTITIQLTVYNPGTLAMSNTTYGLLPNKSGVFNVLSGIDATPIAPKTLSTFNIQVKILDSAPTGQLLIGGYYSGTSGGFSFSDTLANQIDTLNIQSAASLSYVTSSLIPTPVSEGQSIQPRVSIRNDSSASVVLNPAFSYIKYGGDSTFLSASQVLTGGAAVTQLVFNAKAFPTSGHYQGLMVLRGTENSGVFDTSLTTGTDSLDVQTAVNLTTLTLDSIDVQLDTTSVNKDSIGVRLRINNTAQASAVIDSIKLNYKRSGISANGYSQFGLTTLPSTIPGNSFTIVNFFINASTLADTGSIVVDAVVKAHDQNSSAPVQIPNAVNSDSLFVRTSSRLVITSVTTPTFDTVQTGQSGIPVNVIVSNLGGAPVQINSLEMIFKIGLYDTTLTQVLPDTLPGYSQRTYNFIAGVRSNSSVGLDSLGAQATGVDLLSGRGVSGRATGLDTLLILNPGGGGTMTLISTQSVPVLVSRGQDSVMVNVTVSNFSSLQARIDTVRLQFFDAALAPLATGFTVTPYSKIADTISSGLTRILTFKVNIDALADTELVHIDAVLVGRDFFNNPIYDSAATTKDNWIVQLPTNFAVDTINVIPVNVSQGQQNIGVNVVIKNTGEATGQIDSVRLVYYYGATQNTTAFIDTQIVPTGQVTVAENNSAQYSFTVDVNPAAPTGFAHVYAHAFGKDNNSFKSAVDTSRSKSDSINVQTRPAINFVVGSLTPDTVNKGTTVNFVLSLQNTGQASLLLNSSSQLILRDVDSLKVNLTDTLEIASGVTRTLTFNSSLINLRVDSLYRPELRLAGLENGNAYQTILLNLADSVKILQPSLASADSLIIYRLDNSKTTVVAANDSFIVRLYVKNNGGATIENLAPIPASLTLTGSTTPALYSGPIPASVNAVSGSVSTFEWRYRADSSGSVNLSVRAQGNDATTDSIVTSNIINSFLTVTAPKADTIVNVTALLDTIPVYNFVNLTILATDKFGVPAKPDSVRFRILSGTGGFNDTSRTTIDSVAITGADGKASMRLYTSTVPVSNTVVAKLLSTSNDSVVFTVVTLPRAISSLGIAVASNWTAGVSENVAVTAYDQFGNITTNATSNIQLTPIASASMEFTPVSGLLALTSGVASFTAKDTVAKSFMQIVARETVLGTQVLSQGLNVKHAGASSFAVSEVLLSGVTVNNIRNLTATVIDTFGNAVKDTSVTFTVIDSGNGGVIVGGSTVLTDSLGRAIISYQAGSDVGVNVISAQASIPGSIPNNPDSTYFRMTTSLLNANASYVSNSLAPGVVSKNQRVAISVQFSNSGSFPYRLVGDSTYILLKNTVSGGVFRAYLDTNVNRTITQEGVSQLTFRSDTVKLDAGKYPSFTDSAQIFLYGTVFDSAADELDTLINSFGNNILDTLEVKNPAVLILDSVQIVQGAGVRGQDSIKVDYYVRNTGEVTAKGIAVTDSFRANSGSNVSADWILMGGSKPDTLSGLSSSSFSQYYRLKTTAVVGLDYITTRIQGVDGNDATQITRDTLSNSDSIRVYKPAQLIAQVDSFRVYMHD